MYKQIAANKRKTIFLMIAFVAIIVLIGFGLGAANGDIYGGMIFAAIFSGVYSIFGYFKSDKVALAASGAKIIKKEDHPNLWNAVEVMAITSGLPMPRIAIIDDPALNAFATGRDPEHAAIAITTGLLSQLTKVELEGVIAHEMSHIQNYDIRIMTIVVVLVGALALLSDLFRFGLGGSGRGKGGGGYLAIIGIVLLLLSPLIGQLIKMAVGRQREFLADASGALMTRYPEGLASALEKIRNDKHTLKRATHATAHLFLNEPFKKKSSLTRLFSTHPPIEERIKRLRKMA
jgi:heat shock protein HtpX